MKKQGKKKIPIFKQDGLVHHTDYMKICGEEFSASSDNLQAVTCRKCLDLIGNKLLKGMLFNRPDKGA